MQSYQDFLKNKSVVDSPSGFDCDFIPSGLFDFQMAIVRWALKRGRAAIFADTGLGKTMMQTAWAHCVHQYTGNRVLIVAPLCVAMQTIDEAKKLDITPIQFVRSLDDAKKSTGVFITNYEMLDNFENLSDGFFDGIVLDESSILKHQDSKTRTKIIEMAKGVPFKLSCTATPSPNDHMELSSQSEFLGIMDAMEMLAMFFTHDSGETSKWRLKGHARAKFWEWLASWSVFIKKPSDIGFSDNGYDLPPLTMIDHKVDFEITEDLGEGLKARNKAKRLTIDARVAKAAEIANSINGPCLVWCHMNDESSKLAESIHGAAEVSGSDKIHIKEQRIMAFTSGEVDKLVTKPKIAGFGMNWQHCADMIFVGLNDSYEQLYQAIRRCYRFGQKRPVKVHIISSSADQNVVENIKNKEAKAQEMQRELIGYMRDFQTRNVAQLERDRALYSTDDVVTDRYSLHLGDCVETLRRYPDEHFGFSVFSPPFASLYTYSNSERDMGNSKTYGEFWEHFKFLVAELYRTMQSGRNIAIHCMNLPTSKVRDGYIGIRDFRGDIIRLFQSYGFIYHSEVTVWKNPVVAMQRTKALGLLWKQIRKNSAMSRQGIPDYVVTFRKPGEAKIPVNHLPEQFPVDKWQKYASPCWIDIVQSNTLNARIARDKEDERHIAPLQLDLIERCIELWSKPGDIVLSPFNGVGSEGYVALTKGRNYVGIELKKSYFELAKKYLEEASRLPTSEYTPIYCKNPFDVSDFAKLKNNQMPPDDEIIDDDQMDIEDYNATPITQ